MTPCKHHNAALSVSVRIDREACLAGIVASNIMSTEELPIMIASEGKNFCRMGLVLPAIYDIVPRFACHNVYAGTCGVLP